MGMTKIPMVLAASMPAKTEVPTPRRLICAAPWATTSGANPRMKAIEVIITARNRVRAPRVAASRFASLLALLLGELDDQNPVLGRQRDQHDQPDLRIEVQRQVGGQRPTNEPNAPTTTESSTGRGIIQLS